MKLQPTNLGYICFKFNLGIVANWVIFIPELMTSHCPDVMIECTHDRLAFSCCCRFALV